MGEYYNWVNVDKRQYICPANFDYGNKFSDQLPLLIGDGHDPEPGE